MTCRECCDLPKDREIEVQKGELRYYPFHKHWKSIFVPLLKTKEIIDVKRFILDQVRFYLEIDAKDKNFYRYKSEFFDKFMQLDEEQKLDLLDSVAWGKLVGSEDPEKNKEDEGVLQDYNDWLRISKDEYDDKNKLEHYLLLHWCREIALLLFALLKLAFPKENWIIVDNGKHAFVMKGKDNTMIYDILWQYLEIPVENVNLGKVKGYDGELFDPVKKYVDPVEFYVNEQMGEEVNIQDSVEDNRERFIKEQSEADTGRFQKKGMYIEEIDKYQKLVNAFNWLGIVREKKDILPHLPLEKKLRNVIMKFLYKKYEENGGECEQFKKFYSILDIIEKNTFKATKKQIIQNIRSLVIEWKKNRKQRKLFINLLDSKIGSIHWLYLEAKDLLPEHEIIFLNMEKIQEFEEKRNRRQALAREGIIILRRDIFGEYVETLDFTDSEILLIDDFSLSGIFSASLFEAVLYDKREIDKNILYTSIFAYDTKESRDQLADVKRSHYPYVTLNFMSYGTLERLSSLLPYDIEQNEELLEEFADIINPDSGSWDNYMFYTDYKFPNEAGSFPNIYAYLYPAPDRKFMEEVREKFKNVSH